MLPRKFNTTTKENRFMKWYDDCSERILLAYVNGSLRSHIVLPVLMYLVKHTGFVDSNAQFVKRTVRAIAQDLNCSKSCVAAVLNELIDLGIIYKSKYGYSFIENMACKGNEHHRSRLKAVRQKIQGIATQD